jgi:hypothetical protein
MQYAYRGIVCQLQHLQLLAVVVASHYQLVLYAAAALKRARQENASSCFICLDAIPQ